MALPSELPPLGPSRASNGAVPQAEPVHQSWLGKHKVKILVGAAIVGVVLLTGGLALPVIVGVAIFSATAAAIAGATATIVGGVTLLVTAVTAFLTSRPVVASSLSSTLSNGINDNIKIVVKDSDDLSNIENEALFEAKKAFLKKYPQCKDLVLPIEQRSKSNRNRENARDMRITINLSDGTTIGFISSDNSLNRDGTKCTINFRVVVKPLPTAFMNALHNGSLAQPLSSHLYLETMEERLKELSRGRYQLLPVESGAHIDDVDQYHIVEKIGQDTQLVGYVTMKAFADGSCNPEARIFDKKKIGGLEFKLNKPVTCDEAFEQRLKGLSQDPNISYELFRAVQQEFISEEGRFTIFEKTIGGGTRPVGHVKFGPNGGPPEVTMLRSLILFN